MTKYYQVLLYALFMLCLLKKPVSTPFMQSKAKTLQKSYWLRLRIKKEKKEMRKKKENKMYNFFFFLWFFFFLNKKCDGLALLRLVDCNIWSLISSAFLHSSSTCLLFFYSLFYISLIIINWWFGSFEILHFSSSFESSTSTRCVCSISKSVIVCLFVFFFF